MRPLAAHGVDGLGAHGEVGRRACRQLRDAGAEADAPGLRADVGQWRDGVRAISFGGPDRVVAEFLGTTDALDGYAWMGIAEE
jgi:hypothetical protein